MTEKTASLTDRAYRELEEQIVTLSLAPGAVLSENALSGALGIGRTPVREALQRLALEGLVTILPRRGVVVSNIDVRRQLELLQVRREVERLMVSLGARRASPEQRRRLLEIATAMRRAADEADDLGFMRLDRELNLLESDACRNEFAQRAMGLMHGLSRRFWYVHYKEVLDLPLCARLHADLADEIGRGETQAAARACDRLIDYTETFTRAALDAPVT